MDGLQGHTRIHGSEFDSKFYEQIFSKVNNGGRSLHDLDVPCAACYAPTRNAQIMIPGKENMSCRMDDGISRISGDRRFQS